MSDRDPSPGGGRDEAAIEPTDSDGFTDAPWFTSADEWTGDDHDVRVVYNAVSFACDAVDGVEEARSIVHALKVQGFEVKHRPTQEDANEVIRHLATDFENKIEAATLAQMVYGGLKQSTERTLVHCDPKLAVAVLALRHTIDLVAHCRDGDLDDLRLAIRVGFDAWLDPETEQSDAQVVSFEATSSDDKGAPQ